MPGVGLSDVGELTFNLLGEPQRLRIAARTFIDNDWKLRLFTASIQTPTHELRWVGHRDGDDLVVAVSTPSGQTTKRFHDANGDMFVTGLSSWVAFHRLRVGQSGRGWVINPLALTPEPVFFHVRRRERLGEEDALVVETDLGGMSTESWVSPSGEVLKEISPLGWELRRLNAKEALAGTASASARLDLISMMSLPLDRPIGDPKQIAHLTLLLDGAGADQLTLARPWQTLLPQEALAAFGVATSHDLWWLIGLDRPTPPSGQPSLIH